MMHESSEENTILKCTEPEGSLWTILSKQTYKIVGVGSVSQRYLVKTELVSEIFSANTVACTTINSACFVFPF